MGRGKRESAASSYLACKLTVGQQSFVQPPCPRPQLDTYTGEIGKMQAVARVFQRRGCTFDDQGQRVQGADLQLSVDARPAGDLWLALARSEALGLVQLSRG